MIIACENSCSYYLYSTLEDINDIQKAKNILIDKNNYPFTIEKVGAIKYDEVYQVNYQLLKLDIKLPKKYQIDNLYLLVKVKIKEDKLIHKLKTILF